MKLKNNFDLPFKLVCRELDCAEVENKPITLEVTKDNKDYLIEGKFTGEVRAMERYNKYDGDDKIMPYNEKLIKLGGEINYGVIKEIK